MQAPAWRFAVLRAREMSALAAQGVSTRARPRRPPQGSPGDPALLPWASPGWPRSVWKLPASPQKAIL